jgi:hypothetical protein
MRQSPNILPALGKLPVVKLTTQRLHDWHRGLAERARYWRSRKSVAANLAAFDPKDTEDVSRRCRQRDGTLKQYPEDLRTQI